eukprot:TRINITY_DN44793_c0_g1_i1.p1 TRINITY_DN44793_c0_g1~~TRINITY_DN44793_c0_g1_i1.p1  ORF type:complete len:281 (+),score=61.10 TRINITY_DN44793_c0_g1_i1:56-898(+)
MNYPQLFEYIPSLKFLYPFEWENSFNKPDLLDWTLDNTWVSFVVAFAYVAAVFIGQRIMKNKEPLGLKRFLQAWNLLLAVFSFFGAARTVPHLFLRLYTTGFQHTTCDDAHASYGSGSNGFWIMLFVFSKIPEMIDTLFLVLRKRPVIFLHWYHHFTVMLYCWYSYASRNSAGIWFCSMNYTVHAVMYFYYFLRSIGYRPKWDKIVTVMQLSQMVVGVVVSCVVGYYKFNDIPCNQTLGSFMSGVVMYASYFVLFLAFFLKRYIFPAKKAVKKTVPAKEE